MPAQFFLVHLTSPPSLENHIGSEWSVSTYLSPHNWSHICCLVYLFGVRWFLFFHYSLRHLFGVICCHNSGPVNLEKIKIWPLGSDFRRMTIHFQHNHEFKKKHEHLPTKKCFFDFLWHISMPEISTLNEKPQLIFFYPECNDNFPIILTWKITILNVS